MKVLLSFKLSLGCLFKVSPHHVNLGGVQKTTPQITLYKPHTAEESLRRRRTSRHSLWQSGTAWPCGPSLGTLVLTAHIDDFVIACVDSAALDNFHERLLDAFDSTHEAAIHTNLGCKIERDLIAGTTTLSQRYYAEEKLRTYGPPSLRASIGLKVLVWRVSGSVFIGWVVGV